jgi:CRISPR/Cas system CSM-associated protein Csm3 (group 7 of RAMP superfamily)
MRQTPFKAKFAGVLTFEAKTPLHIGGGQEMAYQRILRLPDGSLIIPSSTWKGAFRFLTLRIAQSYRLEEIEKLAFEMLYSDKEKIRELYGKVLELFEEALKGKDSPPFNASDVKEKLLGVGFSELELASKELTSKFLEHYLALYCPIGRLYGNMFRRGAIRFLDSIFKGKVQSRPGIGISRKRGVVEEGKGPFYIETTEVGVRIPLTVIGEIEEFGETPAKLLASTLKAVKQIGLNIGKRKSVGLGLLSLVDSYFHLLEFKDDAETLMISNIFKTPKLTLEEFTSKLIR